MAAQRNRYENVEAIELDDAGAGVGHATGDAGAVIELHVEDLLPGERADVEIDHISPHKAVAWGRIKQRHGLTSADREPPACPGWGGCGGCAWQHLAYPAQLDEKRRIVTRALGAVPAVLGGRVTVAPVVPAPQTLGYRNKGKYVVAAGKGGLVLGAFAPRTHRVIDTAGCRVVAPAIDEIARVARRACAGLEPYDERRRTGELRYVIVRADEAGETLVALVVTSSTRPDALQAAADLLAARPRVRGVVAMKNDRTDGVIVTSDVSVLAGSGTMVEQVAGSPIEVGAGEFLQVNRDQSRAIYARAAELALDGLASASAVDLYAGAGGIALTLARAGARVVAVEIDAASCESLRNAAAAGGLGDRVAVHAADASTVGTLGVFDVVVVDPPRKGLSAETRAALLALAPPRIVYLSCGPESLGRDLAALAHRYHPDVIEPYDLMPGTSQVETLVRLTLSGAASA